MLEGVDLSCKLSKEKYKAEMKRLELKLGELQRKCRELGIPVIVVFEGWGAAGKGTLINELIMPLDPRGYSVHSTLPPNQEEAMRPFLWRFWIRTPARGRIILFDRSWYRRVINDRVDKLIPKSDVGQAVEDICAFERQLAEQGNVIIKLFLHISKKEQKKRFKKLCKDKSTAWRVTEDDRRQHRQYGKYEEAIEEALARTDSEFAPWTVVEAHDRRFASVKIFHTVMRALSRAIEERENAPTRGKKAARMVKPAEEETDGTSALDHVDLAVELDRETYREELKKKQERLRELEHEIYMARVPVVIAYEGWDAAGKGGNLRRLVQNLDPRGYEVVPISAPNDLEKAHHYLWRFWTQVPKAGHITIFDRSWYGRVLVERVEGFCDEENWRRAYREINEMERHLVNFGTVLVKFWLQISPEEQLRRFRERERTPYKQWKITQEDWRNRKKRDAYEAAVKEMLLRTSTATAPWTVVPSNCKWHARIHCMDTVIRAIERAL